MKTRFLLSGLLALSIIGCSTRIINTNQDFTDLEKEYKSFSTKALSDAYVKRMFGKYLAPVNTTQLTRQLEFSRFLKASGDTSYETSLKTMFSQTPVLYDQMTGIGTISNKMSTESATFGTFVTGLSPYPASPTGLSADNISSSGFIAHWNAVNGATSYEIVTDNNAPVSTASNSYNVSGLTGMNHTFKVRAVNISGVGTYSSQIDVTLLSASSPAGIILVKANATGLNNGTSWANAYTSLQSALNVATSGKDIWIASGTYKPGSSRSDTFQLKSGVNIYGGFTGNESVLNQRNFNNNIVILSGDINGDDSNITPTSTTSLKTDNSYHVVTGENNSTLDGVTVKFAYADGSGNDSYGGGMRNIRISQTINNVIFSYNYALCGGGMYNDNATDTNKKPILTNVIFSNNNAYSGGGIGNYISNPILTNVIFFNNSSDFTGGGLYNEISSPIVTNATFSNNTASYGGGIYNYSSSPTVTNATFSNNTGTTGGGMYSESSSTPTVRNSIFWISPILNYSNSSLIMGYSDVQGGFSAITGGGSIQNLSGTGLTSANFTTVGHNINSNPIFVNASDLDGADNILRTSDDGLYLQSGSPARNTGTNTEAPASDIIGTSRPKGIGYDMGAYEFIE